MESCWKEEECADIRKAAEEDGGGWKGEVEQSGG